MVRDRWLLDRRYRVLRFWNNEVLGNIVGVWGLIFGAANAAGNAFSRAGIQAAFSGKFKWYRV
jgi:very-short-patch-repair endonuclease